MSFHFIVPLAWASSRFNTHLQNLLHNNHTKEIVYTIETWGIFCRVPMGLSESLSCMRFRKYSLIWRLNTFGVNSRFGYGYLAFYIANTKMTDRRQGGKNKRLTGVGANVQFCHRREPLRSKIMFRDDKGLVYRIRKYVLYRLGTIIAN